MYQFRFSTVFVDNFLLKYDLILWLHPWNFLINFSKGIRPAILCSSRHLNNLNYFKKFHNINNNRKIDLILTENSSLEGSKKRTGMVQLLPDLASRTVLHIKLHHTCRSNFILLILFIILISVSINSLLKDTEIYWLINIYLL